MAAEPLPLLAQARRVGCAQTAEEARAAVGALRSANALALGFPDEHLTSQGDRTLHASVLDILLAALALGERRHPEIAPDVKALVGSWNTCAIIDAGDAYDVLRREGPPQRRQLVIPMPLGGEGLRAWKLLPPAAGDAMPAAGTDAAAFEPLCGEGSGGVTLFDFVPGVPSGPVRTAPAAPEVASACLAPPPTPLPPPPPPPPLAIVAPTPVPVPKSSPPSPVLYPPPGTAANVVPVVAAPGLHHWTTGVSYSQGLEGQGSLGLLGIFTPVRGLSLRVGASYGLLQEFQPAREARHLTLSWGVGYDGGRPGTWSLHLDNWGPLDPLQPKAFLQGAAFDISYQLRLPRVLEEVLSTSLKLTVPLRGDPSTSAVFVVRPGFGTFVSVALRFSPLDREALTWSYSAGYALARGSRLFSLSYTHWAAAPVFEFEPVKGGALTAGVTWSL